MSKTNMLIWIISLSDNHHNVESVQFLYIFFVIFQEFYLTT